MNFQLCPFPIYTRSGEVHVTLTLSKQTVILDENQIDRMATFLNYTFTNVLRLQKYLMLFDLNASENSYIIVPVKRSKYLILTFFAFPLCDLTFDSNSNFSFSQIILLIRYLKVQIIFISNLLCYNFYFISILINSFLILFIFQFFSSVHNLK